MDDLLYDFQNLRLSRRNLERQVEQIVRRLKCNGLCAETKDLFAWWDMIVMHLWASGILERQDSHYTEVRTRNITSEEETAIVSRLVSEGVSPPVARALECQNFPPEYPGSTLRGLGYSVFKAHPYAEQEYLLSHLF